MYITIFFLNRTILIKRQPKTYPTTIQDRLWLKEVDLIASNHHSSTSMMSILVSSGNKTTVPTSRARKPRSSLIRQNQPTTFISRPTKLYSLNLVISVSLKAVTLSASRNIKNESLRLLTVETTGLAYQTTVHKISVRRNLPLQRTKQVSGSN